MKNMLIITVLLAVLSAGCAKRNRAEYTITVSGAFALYPMMVKWSQAYQKLHPEIGFDINGGGAGKGMSDVLTGMVDLAMVSRNISPEEEARGAWYLAVAYDAVLPTCNASNPLAALILKKGVTRDQFRKIFVEQSLTYWEELYGLAPSNRINVYTRSDACGAGETWAKYLGKYLQEDLKGTGINADPGIAEAVRNDALGIGYNNVNYAFNPETRQPVTGLIPVPLDQDGSGTLDSTEQIYNDLTQITGAIAQGLYPSPPARDLYLVHLQMPTNRVVLAFLKWIITEGQDMTLSHGYVPVKKSTVQTSLNKLPDLP